MGRMKGFLRFLVRCLFGYRTYNEEVLKTPGPVLLIPNHVSWLDWLFMMVVVDDDWKCVVSSVSAQTSWLHRKIMINKRTFPIDTASPYAVKRMAEFLEAKGRLVLSLEDPKGMIIFGLRNEVLEGNLREPDEVLAGLDEVTIEDVQRVAQDIVREDRLNFALIGPFDDPDRFQKLLSFSG